MSGIPLELATVRPPGFPHSLYEELWHLNYWSHFSLALISGENPSIPEHNSDPFPIDNDGLSESSWRALLNQVSEGLEAAASLALNRTELGRKFYQDRTVEGELIVVASHNAYHFGRMVTLRQVLGIWSTDSGDSW